MSKLPVRPIGKYGGLRMTYLKEHRPALYHSLVVSVELDKHLMDIDEVGYSTRTTYWQRSTKLFLMS